MTPIIVPLTIERGATSEPVFIYVKDQDGAPVDVTGYTPFAEIRTLGTDRLVARLAPEITDGPAGEIHVPPLSDEQTAPIRARRARWSLFLENPAGEREPVLAKGPVTISHEAPQPERIN